MISKATHITKAILGVALCAAALGSAGNALANGPHPRGLQFQGQPKMLRFGGSRTAGLQFQTQRTAAHPTLTWRPGGKMQIVHPMPGGAIYPTHRGLTSLANGPWPER